MRTCIISCDVVRRELEQVCAELGCTLPVFWTGSGLHNYPARLCERLQEMIEGEAAALDRILLATGFCGDSFCGLETRHTELTEHCGTYFLTEGWLDSDKSIFAEYRHTVERYGEARAKRVFGVMFAHYERVAVIDTGAYAVEPVYEKAQEMASTLGLRCEILPGKQSYLRTLLTGPWTQAQFLILPPGSTVEREMLSKLY